VNGEPIGCRAAAGARDTPQRRECSGLKPRLDRVGHITSSVWSPVGQHSSDAPDASADGAEGLEPGVEIHRVPLVVVGFEQFRAEVEGALTAGAPVGLHGEPPIGFLQMSSVEPRLG
jgi:hypothetical protein